MLTNVLTNTRARSIPPRNPYRSGEDPYQANGAEKKQHPREDSFRFRQKEEHEWQGEESNPEEGGDVWIVRHW